MPVGKAYRIRGWDTSGFEVAQNSRTRGPLKWVALPTKHDGKGFRRLMRHEEGVAYFGCWCLLVQVAAKCPTRGVLADEDGPLSAADMHLKTDVPADVMSRAIEALIQVGWLELAGEDGPPQNNTPQQSATGCNNPLPTRRNVQDEHNETGRTNPLPPEPPTDDAPAAIPEDIPLPPSLASCTRFRAAWLEWLAYRKSNRQSMRDVTLKKQLEMLAKLGPDEAREAIDTSIRCGWKGVFPPKEKANGRTSHTRVGPGQSYDPATSGKRPTVGGF